MFRRLMLLMIRRTELSYSRGSSGVQLSRRSPAAAKGAVKLDHAEEFIATGLGEAELGVEKFLLVVKHFKVTRHTSLVTHAGHCGRVAMGLGTFLLFLAKFPRALVGDKPVGDF